jgi:hypothetical protein
VLLPQLTTVANGVIETGPHELEIGVIVTVGGFFTVSTLFKLYVPHLFVSDKVIVYIPELLKIKEG